MTTAVGRSGAAASAARTGQLAVFLGAIGVAVICSVIAASGVPGWEESIFHWINDLPDALEPVMWVFQLAGLLFVPLLVAIPALLLRKYRLAIGLVALVPLKLAVEKLVVKQLVERERPGTSVCDLDQTCGNFRGDVSLEGLSYVSGHAIVAWGVVALVWPYLSTRWRVVAATIALLNAVARIYLGAHNALDVVGGAAVGIALGMAITAVLELPRRRTPVEAGEPRPLGHPAG